ncbi:hypothetical protein [Myroides sp. LJL119]
MKKELNNNKYGKNSFAVGYKQISLNYVLMYWLAALYDFAIYIKSFLKI